MPGCLHLVVRRRGVRHWEHLVRHGPDGAGGDAGLGDDPAAGRGLAHLQRDARILDLAGDAQQVAERQLRRIGIVTAIGRGGVAELLQLAARDQLFLSGFSALKAQDYQRIVSLEAAMEHNGGLDLI